MVQCIDSSWTFRDVFRAPGGYLPVDGIDVATQDERPRAVVKASPDEARHGIDLEGPFRPVLGHIDNSLENVRFGPETGEIRAMLDWALTLAVTPAYALVLVEASLRGGQWRFVPGAPDPVDVVRPALLDGYRSVGSATVLERLAANRDCYELLSRSRSTHLLDVWPAVKDATPEQEAGAATAVREALEASI